jgi:hypothetical protein
MLRLGEDGSVYFRFGQVNSGYVSLRMVMSVYAWLFQVYLVRSFRTLYVSSFQIRSVYARLC